MDWFSAIVVFVITWWTVLFAVLPFGVRQPEDRPPEHAHGAPVEARIKRKFLITTLITAVIWAIIFVVVQSGLLSFHDQTRPF